MRHEEFRIGTEFWCGGRRWRCTDVGTRVIVGVCLEAHEVVNVGPPYAVPEEVFDEYDIESCSLSSDVHGD